MYQARVAVLAARKRSAKSVPDQLRDLEGAIERRRNACEKAKASHANLRRLWQGRRIVRDPRAKPQYVP